jgi:hypothetical protein
VTGKTYVADCEISIPASTAPGSLLTVVIELQDGFDGHGTVKPRGDLYIAAPPSLIVTSPAEGAIFTTGAGAKIPVEAHGDAGTSYVSATAQLEGASEITLTKNSSGSFIGELPLPDIADAEVTRKVTITARDASNAPTTVVRNVTIRKGVAIVSVPKSAWTQDPAFVADRIVVNGDDVIVSTAADSIIASQTPSVVILDATALPSVPVGKTLVEPRAISDLAASNGWIFFATPQALQGYDIGRELLEPALFGANTTSVATSGDRLYYGTGDAGFGFTNGWLDVRDINQFWPAPLGVNVNESAVFTGSATNSVNLVAVSPSNEFNPSSLFVFDVTPNGDPVQQGKLIFTDVNAERVAVRGTTAYVTSINPAVIGVVSFADPMHPQLVRTVALSEPARGIAVYGAELFVADGSTGVVTYDIADPLQPLVRSTQSLGSPANDVATMPGYIVATTDAGVSFISHTFPPFIRRDRLSATNSGSTLTISGAANAIIGATPLTIDVIVAGSVVAPNVAVNADGSFTVSVPGAWNSPLAVVIRDGNGNSTDAIDLGTAWRSSSSKRASAKRTSNHAAGSSSNSTPRIALRP